ncbi:YggS family pyridoxal phosphate-dependent enzyme [Proteinivorax hydrogeniformans]|uniref:Pyridoxal phosphate homeostasis protein n=1 Tax=Proteinivorax hydrogeniformans TaxID=1826727 RepID=A0AAU8HQL7_9FIRM
MTVLANYKTLVKEVSQLTERKVEIVPVTKYAEVDKMNALYSNGINNFGESRTENLKIKEEHFPDANWHFIGHLQTRKVKDCVGKVQLIHSINRWKVAKEIDKRAKKKGIVQKGLVQVNVAKEESKHGLLVEEVFSFLDSCSELPNLSITGLMTMAPLTDNPEEVRYVFKGLKELRNKLKDNGYSNIKELSMGMTNDYQVAVEEGATIIRIGSKIFS